MKLILEINCENVKFSFYETTETGKAVYLVRVSYKRLCLNDYVNQDYIDFHYNDAKERFLFEIYKHISRELDNSITDLPF